MAKFAKVLTTPFCRQKAILFPKFKKKPIIVRLTVEIPVNSSNGFLRGSNYMFMLLSNYWPLMF